MKARKLLDVLFILLLGVVSAGLLLGIRGYTGPKIAKYQETRLKTTILDAAGIVAGPGMLEETFSENIREREAGGTEYFLAPDDSYVFEFTGRGLWGMIEGVATLAPDLTTIGCIRIMAQEETPGLGSRIGDREYLDQFRGKRLDPAITLVTRGKAEGPGEVDAISGATISSRALVDVINESVLRFRSEVRRAADEAE